MKQLQSKSSDIQASNVSQKMGRCILRLQQYEILMKTLTANHEFSGYADEIEANIRTRKDRVKNKTLGQLIGELTGSYLSTSAVNAENQEREDESEVDTSRAYFQMRCCLEMDEATYKNTKDGLVQLVALRNELVHHFLARFDMRSESGRHDAELYLDEAYKVIDERYQELCGWGKSMKDARNEVAAFMKTPVFREFVMYGIFPGQEVHWPSTTIVQQLLLAERKFNESGWTSLARAIAYIQPRWQDLTPKRYGCSSWRHVIHNSSLFEVQKRKNLEKTSNSVWYRRKSGRTKEQ